MEKNNHFKLTWLPKKAFEITVTIPWEEISQAQNQIIQTAGKNLEIKGFRKGNAPEKLVREALGPQKLIELSLQKLLPDYFQKAIEEFKIRPIVTPRIELVSAKENEDWQVKFTACVEPEVNLNNYKEEIKKESLAKAIWTPEKSSSSAKTKKEEDKDQKLNRVLEWLIKNVKVEICDLLKDEEVNRKLANLLDQIQKMGLTLDQYLASTGRTVEQLREEYARQAEENLTLEFVLSKIADEEKIEVKPEEIEKVIAETKTEDEKKALQSQSYLLATLLRRQKTLDFLASL